MTYTERPPATVPAAQRAWDYFVANYGSRVLRVYYSPSCYGVRSWICDLEVRDTDLWHWRGDATENHIKDASCTDVERWWRSTH